MRVSNYAAPVLATALILFSFTGLYSQTVGGVSTIIDEPARAAQQEVVETQARGLALVLRTGAQFLANSMVSDIRHAAGPRG